MTEEMELLSQEKIRMLGEKETDKSLWIFEADTIKNVEKKGKIKNEYFRKTRILLEIKLYSRNLIKGMYARVVLLVRFSRPFLKWKMEKLQ